VSPPGRLPDPVRRHANPRALRARGVPFVPPPARTARSSASVTPAPCRSPAGSSALGPRLRAHPPACAELWPSATAGVACARTAEVVTFAPPVSPSAVRPPAQRRPGGDACPLRVPRLRPQLPGAPRRPPSPAAAPLPVLRLFAHGPRRPSARSPAPGHGAPQAATPLRRPGRAAHGLGRGLRHGIGLTALSTAGPGKKMGRRVSAGPRWIRRAKWGAEGSGGEPHADATRASCTTGHPVFHKIFGIITALRACSGAAGVPRP
jgi:hypothetical protein